jgi:hypothetical protein
MHKIRNSKEFEEIHHTKSNGERARMQNRPGIAPGEILTRIIMRLQTLRIRNGISGLG